jgi:hypothetical protein
LKINQENKNINYSNINSGIKKRIKKSLIKQNNSNYNTNQKNKKHINNFIESKHKKSNFFTNYFNKNNNKNHFKNNNKLALILSGILIVTTALSFKLYVNNKKNKEYIIQLKNQYSTDLRVKSSDNSIKQNSSEINYSIDDFILKNTESANTMIQKGITYIQNESSNNNFSQDAYLKMFEVIYNKAEQEPKLMEHFGENAQKYMEKKTLDKYVGVIENSINDSLDSFKEKGTSVVKFFSNLKDTLYKKIDSSNN